MKDASFVFIALIVIISDVYCQDLCKDLYDSCDHDNNCCSKYCYKSTLWLRGFCEESNYIPFPGEISSTIEDGLCEFHSQNDTKESLIEMIDDYGTINAAHESLPPYTLIRLTHKDKRITIIVTINDHVPKTNGTLLDLSNGAAKKLGMNDGDIIPCEIELVKSESVIISFLYILPMGITVFILIMYIMNPST